MDSVGIRELKRDVSAIIKRVQESKEPVEITNRGQVVARIVPVETEEERQQRAKEIFAEMDRLRERMSIDGGEWAGMSAVEAAKNQRRDL